MQSPRTWRDLFSRPPASPSSRLTRRPGSRRPRRINLAVEQVEKRELMATMIGANFAGANINTLSEGFIPPDTMASVGSNNQIVEFLNGVYSVYNKTGTQLRQVTDVSFWNSAGVSAGITGLGLSDPRVVFDPTTSRWFISMIDTRNTANDILLAVSNSIDATGGFKGYVIPGNPPGTAYFADFDTLGIDDHGVYVSTLGFPPSGSTFETSFLFVKKSDLVSEVTTPARKLFSTTNQSVIGNYQPVQDLSGTATMSHNFYSAGQTSTELVTINGTDPATATLSTPASVNQPAWPNLTFAKQPNGPNTIDSGDFRLSGHVIHALGSDWGIQEVEIAGRDALHWIRFNPTTGAILNDGTISNANRDYYYGSIAISPNGNVVIGFTGSSNLTTIGFSGFASSFYVSGTSNGTTLTLGTPALIRGGGGSYNVTYGSGRNRWGDYSNTVVDPADPTSFWTVQEMAPSTNVWSTQITQINVQPSVTGVSSTIANGTYGVGKVIPITVAFDAAVTVNTAGGTPHLNLNLNGTIVAAPYTSGSGTSTLTFTYTVGAEQTTAGAHLDYASATALVLNGGTITSTSNGSLAVVTLPAPGAAGSLAANKSIIIDAVAPVVTGFSVLFGTSGSYNLIGSSRFDLPWQITGISVTFSKPITSGSQASLSGLTTTGFSGLGTNTLTWSITTLTQGIFSTALSGTGGTALTDAYGNPLTGGSGFAEGFRVLYGDFNGDGVVSAADMTGVYLATAGPYNIFADINGDGSVDLNDVRIARSRVGASL